MTESIYNALEKRLQEKVPEIKNIDWFANQYEPSEEEDFVWITPAVFLEFAPVTWQTTGDTAIQQTLMTLTVHTVTDNNLVTKDRFTATQHLTIQRKVHAALHEFSCLLSYIQPTVTNSDDHILLNELTRITSEPDHTLNVFITTKQTYTAQVFDLDLYFYNLQQSSQDVDIDVILNIDQVPKFTI